MEQPNSFRQYGYENMYEDKKGGLQIYIQDADSSIILCNSWKSLNQDIPNIIVTKPGKRGYCICPSEEIIVKHMDQTSDDIPCIYS